MEAEISKNQLVVIETLNPVEAYNTGNIDSVLNKIFEEVKSQTLDISTEKGRKEIASLAYKVSRSKTFLDDLGKKLGEEAKVKLDAINAERKKVRDRLDLLKDEVRKPLTDWENEEKSRIEGHEKAIQSIRNHGLNAETNWKSLGLENLNNSLVELNSDRNWEEFKDRANAEKSIATRKIEAAIETLKTHLSEQAELARLRAAETERLQKERDERIAKEAAERAKREAEELARREAEKIKAQAEAEKLRVRREAEEAERKAQDAIREKEEIQRRMKESEERAKREQQLAVERERQRAEQEKIAKQKEEEKREKNKRHAAKINGEVLKALISSANVDEIIGKAIIAAIVTGKIPHTKISY